MESQGPGVRVSSAQNLARLMRPYSECRVRRLADQKSDSLLILLATVRALTVPREF